MRRMEGFDRVMDRRRAFTLIELLVVIAIIAVLMAVLMPGLRAAKQVAASANCMANSRSLSLAWVMYAEDNDGRLVPARYGNDGWIARPQTEDGTVHTSTQTTPIVTDEDEIRGIERGRLHEYVEDSDVYHCPADNMRISRHDGTRVFVSYSLAACLNGRGESVKEQIKKIGEITSASRRYNFVETAEIRNYTMTYFALGAPEFTGLTTWTWWGPMAVNHNKASILGFCDGHSEKRKWRDQFTLDRYYKLMNTGVQWYGQEAPPADQQEDLRFMADGWAYRHLK